MWTALHLWNHVVVLNIKLERSMVMWSQTIHDLSPGPLLVPTCYSGQPGPALPQERDFAMKTPAVSAGCLQYKHSQGSQREVEWLWKQSWAGRTREHGTVGWEGGSSVCVCVHGEGGCQGEWSRLFKWHSCATVWKLYLITIVTDWKLYKKPSCSFLTVLASSDEHDSAARSKINNMNEVNVAVETFKDVFSHSLILQILWR